MLFNSLEFLILFPATLLLYFAAPHRYRWAVLLTSSYVFYMSWKPAYIFLILISTLIDYGAGRAMGATEDKRKRKRYLVASILCNLGILFAFKYFNFLNDSLRELFGWFNTPYDIPDLDVLLPVGISFYTFQSMSYTIDVYMGKKKAETHLGIFALYVSFFPQLVAGPIERSTRLLPQFFEKHKFDYRMATEGMRLILWGLFKKVVIADRLAEFVDRVYGDPTNYEGLPLWLATYFFSIQVFCDFSAYSDIAIGTARTMGFRLMLNFDRPFLSGSVPEFWRRWHISLSTWFRDYVYIPMGGNRVGRLRWAFNVAAVFVISGVWHGAGWTYVIWGFMHGLYMYCSVVLKPLRMWFARLTRFDRLPAWVQRCWQVFFTFQLINMSWFLFRAPTIEDSWHIVTHLFTNLHFGLDGVNAVIGKSTIGALYRVILLAAVVCLLQLRGPIHKWAAQVPVWVRWPCYIALILAIMNYGSVDEIPFFYFQF